MSKIITRDEAINLIDSNSSIMMSGFLGVGTAVSIIEDLADSDKDGFTIISSTSAYPGVTHGIGRLVANNKVTKFVGAHIGTSKELSNQYLAGKLEVDFIPMGTLQECIHAAGAGLGGVLTPVGIGTLQEDNHEKLSISGKDYLLYEPIGADYALIKGTKVDKIGNVMASGTTRSSSLQMALASKIVIVEASEIVEVGEIDPDNVEVPGPLVNYIVQGLEPNENKEYYTNLWKQTNVLRTGD